MKFRFRKLQTIITTIPEIEEINNGIDNLRSNLIRLIDKLNKTKR